MRAGAEAPHQRRRLTDFDMPIAGIIIAIKSAIIEIETKSSIKLNPRFFMLYPLTV